MKNAGVISSTHVSGNRAALLREAGGQTEEIFLPQFTIGYCSGCMAWISTGMLPTDISRSIRSIRQSFRPASSAATFLERDLRGLAPGIDPLALQRFLRIAATRNGQLLNQASLAGDAGFSAMSAGRYLHLLETSGILARIPPYFSNTSQRWVKSPKLLFVDAALAAYSGGYAEALEDPGHPRFGQCAESFVLQNLIALCAASHPRTIDLYHVRTSSGMQIDALAVCAGEKICIEVKSAETAGVRDIRPESVKIVYARFHS